MLRFAFLVVLASMPFWDLAISLNSFPVNFVQEARTGDFYELCKLFCGNQSLNFHFRDYDNAIQPRIFCGLCKKKLTTASAPTTTPSASTASTTPGPTTVAPTTPGSTSAAPTTQAPTSSGTTSSTSTTKK